MAVEKIVARMYDLNTASTKLTQASENGFEDVMKTATEKSDKEVCSTCAAHAANSAAASDPITSEASSAEGTSATSSSDGGDTFAYRFSMFIRTTTTHEQSSGGLGKMFHQAARGVVNALKTDDSCGCDLIDNFFSKAQSKLDVGVNQSQNFLKDIIEAADTGLKSISNAMLGNSWMSGMSSMNGMSSMSGMSLSMNSSMPGTSGSDIASLYLSEAMNSMSNLGSSGTSNSSAGGIGTGLQLISNPDTESATSTDNSSDVIGEKRLELLDKLLEMMDEFMEKSPPKQNKPFFSQIELAIYRPGGIEEAAKVDETGAAEEVTDSSSETTEVAETVTV